MEPSVTAKKISIFIIAILLLIIATKSPHAQNFKHLPSFVPILSASALCLIFYLSYRFRPISNDKFITILLLIGVLIRLIYLSDTPPGIRNHDTFTHIEYARLIATNKALPGINDCAQCYHPPLYHAIISPFCGLTSCKGQDLIPIQFLSFLLGIITLYYGIKLIRLLMPPDSGYLYYVASSLFILWPSGIIHSIAINNDILLHMFMIMGMYYVCKWFITNSRTSFYISTVFLGLAALVKSNAIIMLAIILCAIFIKYITERNVRLFSLDIIKVLSVSVVIFLLLYSRIHNIPALEPNSGLVGNAHRLSDTLLVSNTINNFIYFDIHNYLSSPFMNGHVQETGKQFFVNYLLKTSLFGEFNYSQSVFKTQALFISYQSIVMLLLVISGLILIGRDAIKQFIRKKFDDLRLVLIVPGVIIFLGALIFMRLLYPFAPSNDYRYIYPATIFVAVSAVYTLYKLNKIKRLKVLSHVGTTLIGLFIISTSCFFITLVFV